MLAPHESKGSDSFSPAIPSASMRDLTQDADFTFWLKELGRRIQARRKALGLTQSQAGERCGVDLKQYQDYEGGRRPITTRNLFRIACGLDVPPAALVPGAIEAPVVAVRGTEVEGLKDLERHGWKVLPPGEADPRRRRAVPAVDLRVNGRGRHAAPLVLAWVLPPANKKLSRTGMFLVRCQAGNLSPVVPEGSWALFHQPAQPPLLGKLVLVRSDASDKPGSWELRRVGGLEIEADGATRVRMDSLRQNVAPVTLRARAEAEVETQGELSEVLGQSGRR
jgi:transcriptional regulator with XRE-family HTH domain